MRNRIMGRMGIRSPGCSYYLWRLTLTGGSPEGLTKHGLTTKFATARLLRIGENVLILLPLPAKTSQS